MSNELTASAAAGVIRNIVNPTLNDHANRLAVTINTFFKGKAKETNVWGVRIGDVLEDNPSFNGFAEGGLLAEGNAEIYGYRTVLYKRLSSTHRMTGDAYRQLMKSDQSLVGGLSRVLERHTMRVKKEENQQLHEDGNGTKAVVDTAGVNQGANRLTFTAPFGAYKVRKNGSYYLVAPNGTVRVNGGSSPFKMKALTIDGANRRVTFDDVPSDAADGDYLIHFNSYQRVITPLREHVSNANTTLQGGDRAATRQYKAIVIDATVAGDGNLSVSLLDQLEDAPLYTTGDNDGSQADVILLSSPVQRSKYRSLGESMRRFVDIVAMFDLGTPTIEHNRHNWVIDPDADPGTIYRLAKKDFEVYEAESLGLLEYEPGKFWMQIPGFDANGEGSFFDQKQFTIVHKLDTFCKVPSRQAKLITLTVPTVAFKPSQAYA